ncbi:MAG: hypothetical protein IJW62_03485 [Clostridia bacterium]|nr:hypothetical protein [Clostridia bacterium]
MTKLDALKAKVAAKRFGIPDRQVILPEYVRMIGRNRNDAASGNGFSSCESGFCARSCRTKFGFMMEEKETHGTVYSI